jgi:hypothetical protein
MFSTAAFAVEKARVKAARAAGLLDDDEQAQLLLYLLARVDVGGGGSGGVGGAGAIAGPFASSAASASQQPALASSKARAKGKQLLKACGEERAEDALRLINEGAYLDFADKDGRTPLIIASEMGFKAITQVLADKGAALDLLDKSGRSALMNSAFCGSTATVDVLMNMGAQLDLVDENGSSALLLSCYRGHTATAQLLASRMDAAALNSVDRDGKTALDWANEGGFHKTKVAELAPAAATIRARGGRTAADLKVSK